MKGTVILMILSGFAATLVLPVPLLGQTDTIMSLDRVVKYGLEHHTSVRNMEQEIRYRQWRSDMERSSYLPEVRSSADYRNNPQLPVTILPGDAFGDPEGGPLEIQMGTRHAIRAGIDIRQTIYDPVKIARIREAEIREELAANSLSGTRKDVALQVTRSYFRALYRKEVLEISTRQETIYSRLARIVKGSHENGLASRNQMEDIRQRSDSRQWEREINELQYRNSIRELKLAMEYPEEDSLIPGDTSLLDILSEIRPLNRTFEYGELPGYKELQLELDLNGQRQKLLLGRYLPSLDAYGFVGAQYFDESFSPVGNDQRWFRQSYLGVTLRVPIFEGLGRNREKQSLLISQDRLMQQQKQLGREIRRREKILANRLEIAHRRSQMHREEFRWKEDQFRTQLADFQNGIADYSSVLRAELEMQLTGEQYKNSLFGILTAILEYKQLVSVY